MNQVQDVLFLNDEEFVSSGDVVSKDSAAFSIMAWDYESTAVLSNQIFHEKYVCTCLRLHPANAVFYAQTHGDYICEFSARAPFKMNKYRRYEGRGHVTRGYSIGFDLNAAGNWLASGSTDGCVYVYDVVTSKLAFKLDAFSSGELIKQPVMDVRFQAIDSNDRSGQMLAVSGWNGKIKIFQI
jgi:WD40 repeat protein